MAGSTTQSPIRIDLLLGPLLIGTIFNAFVYGICFLQFSTYWMSQWNDSYVIKLLVGWTFLLDTFHTSALTYMLWVYVVDHFSDPTFLGTVIWPFSATPLVTTLTSFPIQVYLSWRIKQFAKSRRVFIYLVLLAAAQASLGLTCSITAYRVPDIADYHELVPFVDAWQVLAVAADGSITVLLWYYLSRSRTGLKQSDNVITRLIRSSVETAAIGAFFCIMDLITFTTLQRKNFHVIFAFPMGRIYTNTLLSNLNKRQALRTELERTQIPDLIFDQSHYPSSNTIPNMVRTSEQTISLLNVNVYNVPLTDSGVPGMSLSSDAQKSNAGDSSREHGNGLNKNTNSFVTSSWTEMSAA